MDKSHTVGHASRAGNRADHPIWRRPSWLGPSRAGRNRAAGGGLPFALMPRRTATTGSATPRTATRRSWAAALIATSLLLAGCGAGGPADDAANEASRVQLATALPENAPGQQLYLVEVTIPGGVTLQKHVHEGTQIASVRSGTLTYVIESGTALVTRADGAEERVTGPITIELEVGESLVEDKALVHYGQNLGEETVVVTLAALLREGAPLSTPVD